MKEVKNEALSTDSQCNSDLSNTLTSFFIGRRERGVAPPCGVGVDSFFLFLGELSITELLLYYTHSDCIGFMIRVCYNDL